VNHYELTATNDIGDSVCTADITTQNQPPVLIPFSLTGAEDTMFTGTLMATDASGDTIYFSLFTPASQGVVNVDSISGLIDYTPNPDFCGVDTFDWRALDQFGREADPTTATVTTTCTNDAPVAIDDNTNATGGVMAAFDVLANDTDVDS
jgi:hypothetical protein